MTGKNEIETGGGVSNRPLAFLLPPGGVETSVRSKNRFRDEALREILYPTEKEAEK